jgi:hypothetical protein
MKALLGVVGVALSAAVVLVALATAEEDAAGGPGAVVANCEKALAAAKTEDWDACIEACQKAIHEAQQIKLGGMAALFPDAPAGWTAGEIEKQNMAIGAGGSSQAIVHVKRDYTRSDTGGSTRVEAMVSDWSVYQQSYRSLLQMRAQQAMLQAMGLSFFERDGFPCMKMEPPDGDETQIVAFGDKRVIVVEGKRGENAVQTIFDLFPLKEILK